jgi:hypothetical protein
MTVSELRPRGAAVRSVGVGEPPQSVHCLVVIAGPESLGLVLDPGQQPAPA